MCVHTYIVQHETCAGDPVAPAAFGLLVFVSCRTDVVSCRTKTRPLSFMTFCLMLVVIDYCVLL